VPVATAGQVIGMEFNVAVMSKLNDPTVNPPDPATMDTDVPVAVAPPPENAALAVLLLIDHE